MQLYFLKILGCKAADLQMNIDLKVLGWHILNHQPCPGLFLRIGQTPAIQKDDRWALDTPVQVLENNKTKHVYFASTFYVVGQVTIWIVYNALRDFHPESHFLWNPQTGSKVLKLRDFNELEELND